VKAVDNLDAACESQEELVTVTEERMYPTVMAEAIRPLSNCDMTRPNAIAIASVVNGVASDYIFEWYEGSGTGGTQIYADNVQADGLTAMIYTVHAIDRVTGCDGLAEVTVPDGTAPLPPTDIQVVKLQDVSTCAPLDPDGALSASVNGDVINFDFYWYNSNPGPVPDITTADFAGREFYDSLAAGTYYVSVVNRTTGCAGGPASGVIGENPVYPDFEFITEAATCKKNDADPADGYISLVMKNMAVVDRVEWTYQGSGVSFEVGPTLANADAGTYTVTVTTIQGCKAAKDVVLKTDIRPFNGISRNNDGQNDTFVVKCLEEFPDNIVRIFNRAGTLVYEAEHYDNIDIYFDGVSNKGISLMGNNLPDGTYFYVIDKRDGSKPVAGYLEIVN
jgi:large repetitive protein